MKQVYGSIYEDYQIRYETARTYIWYDICHRCIVALFCVTYDGLPTL